MSKILVNVALPYANGPIHLGHVAGAYLSSDIFVRFLRMHGHEVMFVSGSDEHGTPATLAADRLHISPKDIADRYHKEHVESFRKLDIIFDIYTRTTYPEHRETVAEFFLDFQQFPAVVALVSTGFLKTAVGAFSFDVPVGHEPVVRGAERRYHCVLGQQAFPVVKCNCISVYVFDCNSTSAITISNFKRAIMLDPK